mmetsp:Transcript_2310/g.3303  ORF Transcript_2310/g.3303 Transcript_2310/m.3303 type:complete len:329 (-) Transcript_2310:58-1044(-)|eukprot:CAMPEP_0184489616 /NCGR_PEP_ID=MMETSP0113_2-20130426/15947_1 /TAXON_ID=91329 /ORGANISM="Norrisiella sphaerica, Strain BC52" /LENGTH=328 /DNA_ID=CAMNT_0026873145 /DNA_START=74 /DNA_END=1060 /DNA_ORIENTATION=-
MDQYRRVETKKPEMKIQEDEIRITAAGRPNRHYVNYALKKLGHQHKSQSTEADDPKEPEKEEAPLRSVTFRAMGQAINTTVLVVEMVKRIVPGLHQINEISSSEITDVYEPLYEGLKTVTVTRRVPRIEITLSKDPPADMKHVGYQAPKDPEELAAEEKRAAAAAGAAAANQGGRGKKKGRSRGRGRGRRGRRGGRKPSQQTEEQPADVQNGDNEPQNEEGKENGGRRGKSRGRGRGRRGRRGKRGGNRNEAKQNGEGNAEQGKDVTETPQNNGQDVQGGDGRGGRSRGRRGGRRRGGRRGRGRGKGRGKQLSRDDNGVKADGVENAE